MAHDVVTRQLPREWLHCALELELIGYPPDEAASASSFAFRQANAPELFRGAWKGEELVGFVCATRCAEDYLTHDSMTHHVPTGPTVCIHSVCVAVPHQRQGVALRLLRDFVDAVKTEQVGVDRICLLAHANLAALYCRAGFQCRGGSAVCHGPTPWLDFVLPLM